MARKKIYLSLMWTKRITLCLAKWISTKKPQYHCQFNDIPISQVQKQKFLCVWFREQFTWTTYVIKLNSQLSKLVGCVGGIWNWIPNWLKKNLYYVPFYSKFCYNVLVRGTTTVTNNNKLHLLQERVLRNFENYHGNVRDFPSNPCLKKKTKTKKTWIIQSKPDLLLQTDASNLRAKA